MLKVLEVISDTCAPVLYLPPFSPHTSSLPQHLFDKNLLRAYYRAEMSLKVISFPGPLLPRLQPVRFFSVLNPIISFPKEPSSVAPRYPQVYI